LKLNIIIDMSYELTGKLHKKYPTENKTDSFQAREFVVLMESGNYPQYIKLQLTQDRCALLDPYEEGQEIKVHFDLRGREWNDKYFTNLNAWRVDAPAAATAPSASAGEENFFPTADDEPSVAADDDLPF
jgi:single-strand DNA-binding protein